MTVARRLYSGAAVIVVSTAYLGYLGAASSWQFYLTVDEVVEQVHTLGIAPVRVSGTVADGSLCIAAARNEAEFVVEGEAARLQVRCSGAIPDNLAEGVAVVAEGRIAGGKCLEADRVLTRCASKYSSSK